MLQFLIRTFYLTNLTFIFFSQCLGTRFRPLSLDEPKPLFSVAGYPIIQHHIEACVKVPDLKEIIILGYYAAGAMSEFVSNMIHLYGINIRFNKHVNKLLISSYFIIQISNNRYLQEFAPLGTAGGLYHFRDQIRVGNPDFFFVLNGDVCADFSLNEMLDYHQTRHKEKDALLTLMVTEAARDQSLLYGCVIENKQNNTLEHYVEKPSTFISTLINCGIYVFSPEVFQQMTNVFNCKQADLFT